MSLRGLGAGTRPLVPRLVVEPGSSRRAWSRKHQQVLRSRSAHTGVYWAEL